jgi:hypothetical protein
MGSHKVKIGSGSPAMFAIMHKVTARPGVSRVLLHDQHRPRRTADDHVVVVPALTGITPT